MRGEPGAGTTARRERWIGAALATSFALNVAALFLPFLETDAVLENPKLYSLPRSVALMWDAGLYALAALVVAFSILFPFAKLYVLWNVWRGRYAPQRAHERLAFVERFGKWSLLDVFIVCLLLGLTGGQFFVDARALAGLPCFLAAVLLSMLCGEALASRAGLHAPNLPARRRTFLLWLAAGVHLAAVTTPFLAIDSFWLSSNRVSVTSMAHSLFQLDWAAWAPAVSVAAFVVAAPLLALLARGQGSAAWTARFSRWSMLDVFLLALVVYLIEGKSFVPTRIAEGAYWLAGAMALSLLARRAARR